MAQTAKPHQTDEVDVKLRSAAFLGIQPDGKGWSHPSWKPEQVAKLMTYIEEEGYVIQLYAAIAPVLSFHIATCCSIDFEAMRHLGETAIAQMVKDFTTEFSKPKQMLYELLAPFEKLKGMSILHPLILLFDMHCARIVSCWV